MNARHAAPLARLVDEVVDYEKQGFGSYWMQQASTFDALTMMGVIGHGTSKIELGIATIPTYPRHPGTLVHQAGTVNVLAGGRLVLGVGPTAEESYETLALSYGKSVATFAITCAQSKNQGHRTTPASRTTFQNPSHTKCLSPLYPRRCEGLPVMSQMAW